MQNSYARSSNNAHVAAAAAHKTCPFPEIKFVRLKGWMACESQGKTRSNAALSGQGFQSYTLPSFGGVFMHFCWRGAQLKIASAAALAKVLSHAHAVNEEELFTIEEILGGPWVDPLNQDHQIKHAQVGDLNGKLALAIEWLDTYRGCKRISLYMCTNQDGTMVREIHFSAPVEAFDKARRHFSEALRSLQWQECSVRQVYHDVA